MSKSKSSAFHKVVITLFFIYLAALCVLYFATFKDTPDIPKEIFGIKMDKIAHFLMFFPYPFLAHRSLTGKRKWRNLVFVILGGIVLAYGLELSQHTVNPARTTDPWDLVVNIASLSVSTFILALIDLIRK